MAYQPQTYQDGVTEYTDTMFQHMDDGIFGAYPVQLIAISSIAPSTCAKDDKYYNSTSKKIFTATATNTWGSTGTTPIEDTSYWLISENGNYAWDGTDLVSIGGGKAEVVISDTEPDDGKLWIDTAEIPTIAGKDNLVNIGTSVDSSYRTNILHSKNLFDKDNYNIISGYFLDSTLTITSATNPRIIWVECEGNTTYTIQKVKSARFKLGTTTTTPAIGVQVNNFTENEHATQLSITTSASAKYLLVYCYQANEDTLTLAQILNSLIIQEGSSIITPSIVVDNEEIYSKPVVLWANSSPSTAFATQTITLSDDIENYNYYQVIYRIYYNSTGLATTGRLLVDKTTLFCNDQYNRGRNISQIGGTSLKFGDCYYYATYGNATASTNNNYIIPVQVIGYK